MRAADSHPDPEGRAAGSAIAGTSFAVADMTCGHCVATVRAAITRAAPGTEFEIDLAAHRVTVGGDQAAARAAAEAMRAAGYTPEPIGE